MNKWSVRVPVLKYLFHLYIPPPRRTNRGCPEPPTAAGSATLNLLRFDPHTAKIQNNLEEKFITVPGWFAACWTMCWDSGPSDAPGQMSTFWNLKKKTGITCRQGSEPEPPESEYLAGAGAVTLARLLLHLKYLFNNSNKLYELNLIWSLF